MGQRLDGKVAIVTGGGSGIGRSSAMLLGSEGAAVLVADIDDMAARSVADEITRQDGRASAVRVDVSKSPDVQKMIGLAISRYGRLDILFNNAGVQRRGTIEEVTEEDWHAVIETNLTSVFLGCKYAIPLLKAQGGGVIINTASIGAVIGIARCAAYCASKGGVLMLTKQLQLEYQKDNIRVNAICPSAVDTPLMNQRFQSAADPQLARTQWEQKQPIGRMLTPAEIAKVVLFLAADGLPNASAPYIQ